MLAASGGPGPKLREGDLQVPEGVYRLTAFNPNSSYHLSLRVDYPNAEDRAAEDRAVARSDRRTSLGGDIFIHGKAVSIGCLAIGDPGIEELLRARRGRRPFQDRTAPVARCRPQAHSRLTTLGWPALRALEHGASSGTRHGRHDGAVRRRRQNRAR